MNLAFATLACPDWTLEQCVEAAERYGYAGLELRLLDGKIIDSQLSREQRRRVRAVATGSGIAIVGLDTSVRIAEIDPDDRDLQVREGLALLELAHDLQAPFIRVFAGPSRGASEEDSVAASVATLARLVPRGAELGVIVALETHDAFSRSALVAEVLGRMGDSGAGALWDFLHPYHLGEPARETAQHLAGQVVHVHMKDGRRSGSPQLDWTLTLMGEGEVPTLEMLALLRAGGYEGWLSVEWEKKWHPELEPPEVALPQHAGKIREYVAALAHEPSLGGG